MGGLGSDDILLFSGFRFDPRAGALYRLDQAGGASPVPLGARALDLLALLVGRPGELVLKDEIMAAVWPGRVVEEGNLNVQISKLRHILDQNRREGSCIQTVTGFGYRFAADITRPGPPALLGTRSPSEDTAEDATAEFKDSFAATAAAEVRSERASSTGRMPRGLASGVIASLIGGLGLLVILIAATGWHSSQPANLKAPPFSIVVLPFANLGGGQEQQYFADGVTEDLTTDLSRIGEMFVISHNTALSYRNKLVDTKQLGRELGVRYVLEGSVQRSSREIRINAQLSAADNAANLWSQRFESDTDDLFALQNKITRRIAVALKREVVLIEAARPTEPPGAFDYILRGRAALMKPATRDSHEEAIELFERALEIEPQSVIARSWLARALATRVTDGISDSVPADVARAEEAVRRALTLSPRSPLAHYARGTVLRVEDRFDDAIPEYEMAIDSDRNWLDAYANLAQCKLYTGSLEEVIPLLEQAIRLSPRDPMIAVWFGRIGLVYLLQSEFDKAIYWLEKARKENPGLPYLYSRLAAAHALRGETRPAAAELAEARSRSADQRYSSIEMLESEYLGVPKVRTLYENVYFAGLRLAGMPKN